MEEKEVNGIVGLVFMIIIVLSAIAIIWSFFNNTNKDFTITDNLGNETDFVIKIVDCTLDIPLDSDDFYIDGDYVKMQRYYFEKVNETYGKACWYDAFKKENLTEEWLDENCEINKNSWSCDKGFIVR